MELDGSIVLCSSQRKRSPERKQEKQIGILIEVGLRTSGPTTPNLEMLCPPRKCRVVAPSRCLKPWHRDVLMSAALAVSVHDGGGKQSGVWTQSFHCDRPATTPDRENRELASGPEADVSLLMIGDCTDGTLSPGPRCDLLKRDLSLRNGVS